MKYNAYEVVNALINAKLARRWTKNGMDRLYIDLSAADAWTANSDVFPGRFAVNRYERQNGKMWIDLKTGKVDTRFFEHYNALSGRIPLGVYVYSYARSVEEAKQEARWALNLIKGLKNALDGPKRFVTD